MSFFEFEATLIEILFLTYKDMSREFDESYKIEEKIGEGGCGVVYKCTSLLDGGAYAVKVVSTHAGSISRVVTLPTLH